MVGSNCISVAQLVFMTFGLFVVESATSAADGCPPWFSICPDETSNGYATGNPSPGDSNVHGEADVFDRGGPNIITALPGAGFATTLSGRFQVDLIGDYRFSKYNFTDLKDPYDGLDGFTELKPAFWLDDARTLGPYASILPVVASEGEFFFQRHVQFGVGPQWYPFLDPDDLSQPQRYLRAVRIFMLAASRKYYDEDVELVNHDLQVGMDYYYDNVFTDDQWAVFLFSNATWRDTNFSFEGYHAFLWSGNVKIGPRMPMQNALLVPYGVVDWTWVPRHQERFFENFLRVGGGVRFYPKTDEAGGFAHDLVRRFHVFAEVVHNVVWLGDAPANRIRDTDVRVGFSFATGGFFRQTAAGQSQR